MVNKKKTMNKNRLNKKKNNNNNKSSKTNRKQRKSKRVKNRLSRVNVNTSRKLIRKQRGGYTTTSALSHNEPARTECAIKRVIDSDSKAFHNSFKKSHEPLLEDDHSLESQLNSLMVRGYNGIKNQLFSKF